MIDDFVESAARRGEPNPAVAGRADRALANRTADPLCKQSAAPHRGDLDRIAASIRKWGWTNPALVDENGVLIAGHGRIGAAAKLKLTSIPVIVARGWSEEEKQAYRLADNELAARGSWDFDLLGSELRDLQSNGFDLDLIGFEPDRLKEILAGLGSSGLTDPDSVPETPDQPVTRPGDVWLLGDHRVGCGDSTSAVDVALVLAGSQPHLMVTDPPYGVGYDPSWRACRGGRTGALAQGTVLNDDRADWRQAYALFPGDVAYVWHGAMHGDIVAAGLAACGFQLRAQVVWAKQHFTLSRGDYHWKHECCWYAVRDGKTSHWTGDRTQTTVWEFPNNNPFGQPAARGQLGAWHAKAGRSDAPPDRQQQPAGGFGLRPVSRFGHEPDCGRNDRPLLLWSRALPAYVDVVVQRWHAFTGRAATLEASGQSFDERAASQDRDQTGSGHG